MAQQMNGEVGILESTLAGLKDHLASALSTLNTAAAQQQLEKTLYNDNELPSRKIYDLASEVADLLNDIRLKLEPGPLIIADHAFGHLNSQAILAADKLCVADNLASGPKTLEELAKSCSCDARRLECVLGILTSNGLFTFDRSAGRYDNNFRSRLLLKDHPSQWRTWVSPYGDFYGDVARHIPDSCTNPSKRSPMQLCLKTDEDTYTSLVASGWMAPIQTAMSASAVAQAAGLVEDYPWHEIGESPLLDVGGGNGGLVASLLRRYPKMRAALLDLPKVVEAAKSNFHDANGQYKDVGTRLSDSDLIVGDFFKELPSYEVYVIKWTLHNWADPETIKILANMRAAMKMSSLSRVVVLDNLLSSKRSGQVSRYGDAVMMMSFASDAKERDTDGWIRVAAQAGFLVRKIYPIRNAWAVAIELVPDPSFGVSTVEATMQFVTNRAKSVKMYLRSNPAEGFDRTNLSWETHKIQAHDGRSTMDEFELDRHGFAFVSDKQAVSEDLLDAIRKNEVSTVREQYYPHIENLLKAQTGARRVLIYDHTLRRRYPEEDKNSNADGREQPATIVHVDASPLGAVRRLKENIGPDEDPEEALKRGVLLVNVWKPLHGPVLDWPLAMMDRRSCQDTDRHMIDLWKVRYEDHRQSVTFTHDDAQRWWFLGGHTPAETTMIKIWDSREELGVADYCPHCAFEHPDAPAGVRPRESIEVRCVVLL